LNFQGKTHGSPDPRVKDVHTCQVLRLRRAVLQLAFYAAARVAFPNAEIQTDVKDRLADTSELGSFSFLNVPLLCTVRIFVFDMLSSFLYFYGSNKRFLAT
jgi:hypothetical protein